MTTMRWQITSFCSTERKGYCSDRRVPGGPVVIDGMSCAVNRAVPPDKSIRSVVSDGGIRLY